MLENSNFPIIRVEAGIMRQMVLWDTACNFNAFISNQPIFNCLITGASNLIIFALLLFKLILQEQ